MRRIGSTRSGKVRFSISARTKKFIALSAAILGVLVFFINVLQGSSYNVDPTLTEKPNGIFSGLKFRTDEVDIREKVLWLTISPELSGPLGKILNNGSLSYTNITFNLDVYYGSAQLKSDVNQIVPSQKSPIRLLGNVQNFPFDTYTARLLVTSQQTISFSDERAAAPLYLIDDAEVIPGFSMSSSQVPFSGNSINQDQTAGLGVIEWQISRTPTSIVTVLLLILTLIGGVSVSLLITLAIIQGKRPPSINALAWLAAFLFAMFSIRAQFPGGPPNGINIDRWIFYPAVLTMVILIAVNVVAWVTRDDWDLENPMFISEGSIFDRRGKK